MPSARTHSVFLLVLALGMVGAASPALAVPAAPAPGAFQINPVRIDLSNDVRTGVLTLRSGEAESARFQVTAFKWNQGTRGEIQLEPTRDVSFFPSLFQLEPGEAKQIRVGVSLPPASTERSYRIIIEQLPPLDRSKVSASIKVLTRLSIPIFVAPAAGQADGRLEDVSIRHGRLDYALRNAGAVHLLSRPLRVTGRNAAGRVLLEREQPGWYVLAGGVRRYELELPKATCKRLSTIAIETTAGDRVVAMNVPVRAAQCAR